MDMMKIEDLLQDDKERAVGLLKKAFDRKHTFTFKEIRRALDLDFVQKYLDEILTSDVLPSRALAEEETFHPSERKPRVRFSPEDKYLMRELVMDTISQSAESGTTVEDIIKKVQGEFATAPAILISGLIRDLEKEKKVEGNNTRPKRWFAVLKGKTKGEAMTIKKKKDDTLAEPAQPN